MSRKIFQGENAMWVGKAARIIGMVVLFPFVLLAVAPFAILFYVLFYPLTLYRMINYVRHNEL